MGGWGGGQIFCASAISYLAIGKMHRYTSEMRYATRNGGCYGQPIHVGLNASFPPGTFSLMLEDMGAHTTHTLASKRFSYQSRDSPADLLARDKWRPSRLGRFAGTLDLQFPRIRGAPDSLKVTLICSCAPTFAVVDFCLNDTHRQLPFRPPHVVSNWSRQRFTSAAPDTMGDIDIPYREPTRASGDLEADPTRPYRHRHHFRRVGD